MATASKKAPVLNKTATSAETKKPVSKKLPAQTSATQKATAAAEVKKPAAKPSAIKTATPKPGMPKMVSAEAKPAKVSAVKKTAAKNDEVVVSPEHRYHMIATAAYYIAERRGFAGGSDMHDWISAEAEVDTRLKLAI